MSHISVLSIGFNDCLWHGSDDEASTPLSIFTANCTLIDLLRKKGVDYETRILYSGSNRQSFEIECCNSNQYSYSFLVYPELATALNYNFNPMLLADIESELEPGSAFRQAVLSIDSAPLGSSLDTAGHPTFKMNESKIKVLYAQIHHAACNSPTSAHIDFDFYDGRVGILETLAKFFYNYPFLIPQNVTLRLHHHNKDIVDRKGFEIHGEGIMCNINFHQTIAEINAQADKGHAMDVFLLKSLFPTLSGNHRIYLSSLSDEALIERVRVDTSPDPLNGFLRTIVEIAAQAGSGHAKDVFSQKLLSPTPDGIPINLSDENLLSRNTGMDANLNLLRPFQDKITPDMARSYYLLNPETKFMTDEAILPSTNQLNWRFFIHNVDTPPPSDDDDDDDEINLSRC